MKRVFFVNSENGQKLSAKPVKESSTYILPTGVKITEAVLKENNWSKE